MAELIVGELESPPHRASPELRISADDVLRLFYPSPARTVVEQTEIATIILAIGEIQTGFTCDYPRSAVIVRGTPAQIEFAGRLFDELDRKENAQPHTRHSISTEFRGPGGNMMRCV